MNRNIWSRIAWLIAVVILVSPASAADFGPVQPMKVDAKKAALGKRLFFDPRLSGDAAISCSTCHKPEKGFADGLPLAKAYPGTDGFRNTPTLINAAHKAACGELGRERGKLERGEIKPAALDATIEKATQAAEARALAFKALLAAAPRIGAKG